MSYEQGLKCFSGQAGSDLSTKQFYFVNMASDGQIDVAGAGARVEGVLQDKPDTVGRACQVAYEGISKVIAGGSLTVGDSVSSDASGKARLSITGDVVVGTVMPSGKTTAASAQTYAAGDLVPVLLKPAGAAGP